MRTLNHPKPIVGLVGGIGAGKSTVARQFASLGCAVIDSDALAHNVLQTDDVKALLRDWLGPAVFQDDGSVSRHSLAAKIFADPVDTQRLNRIIHPRVARLREEATAHAMRDPAIKAIVWDTPLLLEVGLNAQCDAIVFINVPKQQRLERVLKARGWTAHELDKRENFQIPLDKKADIADYCIDNSGDEAACLRQVQRVLSQILASVD